MTTSLGRKEDGASVREVALLSAGFFGGMVCMEIALEAAGKWYGATEAGPALPAAVTLSQFAGCMMLPAVIESVSHKGGGMAAMRAIPFREWRMLKLYLMLSMLVSGATALSTASLLHVSYTTKVAFKSAKLVPTMVVATLLGGKLYGPRQYTAAVLLCVGAACFAIAPGAGGARAGEAVPSIGIALLLVSVACDALVPNVQARLMQMNEVAISPAQLMVNTNSIGLLLALGWMLARGELALIAHAGVTMPTLLPHLALIGACLAGAVLCYTRLIARAGAVLAVGVSTLRKAATLALSQLVFPKLLSPVQLAGAFAVVVGIVLASTIGSVIVARCGAFAVGRNGERERHSLVRVVIQ